ncbi:MAG TPA: glycosyltransferase family 2 protein [Solirubrobacteraceae bacterium]|nr:glycosyltransferase family 2 protein [Solirubrobacteraceae bacterium]
MDGHTQPTETQTREDALSTAYQQRTEQLYETRGALAEAVATLNVELAARRAEIAGLRAECEGLRAECEAVRADNDALRDNAHALTASLQQSHERRGAGGGAAQDAGHGVGARESQGRPLDCAGAAGCLSPSYAIGMSLVPPDAGDPELSVVMATHGAWALTARAIAALEEHTVRDYELIIVDNVSEDETRERLADVADVRVILSDENRGFGPATNEGARLARADHLLLLNTDAFVHRGWLEPLLETIAQPGVGAVVPRLLHPDGSLQDAGMLLAQDGTVLVHGDGDDSDRLCYRFRRTIDYGSAACLLIRRSAFELLGGFDEDFAPAYYEDADLGMRLAKTGLSTVYEPRSTVTHVRYGSGASEHARELSERNRRVFTKRWSAELTGRPWTYRGTTGQVEIAGRDAPAMPRMVICAAPEEPGAEPLIRTLLELMPRARVTWATATRATARFDPDAWMNAGVELADATEPGWLSRRLFHYDAAVVGHQLAPVLRTALNRTQPYAPRIPLSVVAGSDGSHSAPLTAALASAGIAVLPSVHEREPLT